MVVISCLRPSARGLKAVLPVLRCSPPTISASKQVGPVIMSCRGGAGRAMPMRTGLYLDRLWRDGVQFFLVLGTIPALGIITLSNLFSTHGELTDLPEDQNPQTWEYHKHPITRFIAKYIVRSPEKLYEVHMAMMYEQDQKRRLRLLERQVKRVMLDRQDVRGWYYFQGSTDIKQQTADEEDPPGTPF
ncbi:NADH dehydrogenase [ubiquinone] 1 beta subcomplex subunit 5, mitochondrial-like [Mizuhopecten yessoensis]|uniref:NADH dehydrogenase [ubiquinone] 1 beta subcomplex subunit 5, mitochondrial-like n=1 Tax=Mizuhopecten yessoensis TaxID=6573 RepID=UPI000B45948B|nr:NADH dehydrogenase [ubiquinone] 1 beta subcomplex subunit 5, mitochondrial-like [Mizuhopecten yessoensis]